MFPHTHAIGRSLHQPSLPKRSWHHLPSLHGKLRRRYSHNHRHLAPDSTRVAPSPAPSWAHFSEPFYWYGSSKLFKITMRATDAKRSSLNEREGGAVGVVVLLEYAGPVKCTPGCSLENLIWDDHMHGRMTCTFGRRLTIQRGWRRASCIAYKRACIL